LFLRLPTATDAKNIVKLHKSVHSVDGWLPWLHRYLLEELSQGLARIVQRKQSIKAFDSLGGFVRLFTISCSCSMDCLGTLAHWVTIPFFQYGETSWLNIPWNWGRSCSDSFRDHGWIVLLSCWWDLPLVQQIPQGNQRACYRGRKELHIMAGSGEGFWRTEEHLAVPWQTHLAPMI
jgi:hypothetical protein